MLKYIKTTEEEITMKSGVVVLYKDGGMSSQSAVNRLKRILGAEKAGHTGTLDPMATGVLPILIGRAVKASEYLTAEDKHYGATLLLGITTDTEDVTGAVLTECDKIPGEDEVKSAVLSMVGESMQTPPMYSAIKVGGRKLYDLAREGITVEREPRKITVHSIDCKRLSENEYFLDIKCSKGTYVRTLYRAGCRSAGAGRYKSFYMQSHRTFIGKSILKGLRSIIFVHRISDNVSHIKAQRCGIGAQARAGNFFQPVLRNDSYLR